MESPELLVHWTARAAFALYVLALLLRGNGRLGLARWLWTCAWTLLLVHVCLAFETVHRWSHLAAYENTARQTADLFGLNWGGGLYVNYVMLLVWLVDVLWWWGGTQSYEIRRPVISRTMLGFLAFMWVNATVVFGHGRFRWAALAGFVLLVMEAFPKGEVVSRRP